MSDERVRRILDAAHECAVRHGVRKTTMEDIAAVAGMSRPAVYQYVRNKEDAFRRLAARIFDAALARARDAAGDAGTLTQRLDRILAVKLEVVQQGGRHVTELIGIAAEQYRSFIGEMTDMLTATIIEAAGEAGLALGDGHAREVAELALALTRGLEADPPGPDGAGRVEAATVEVTTAERTRERLRNGVALMVAGLAAVSQPGSRPRPDGARRPTRVGTPSG
jgi:AcrR family transcriptional regulator